MQNSETTRSAVEQFFYVLLSPIRWIVKLCQNFGAVLLYIISAVGIVGLGILAYNFFPSIIDSIKIVYVASLNAWPLILIITVCAIGGVALAQYSFNKFRNNSYTSHEDFAEQSTKTILVLSAVSLLYLLTMLCIEQWVVMRWILGIGSIVIGGYHARKFSITRIAEYKKQKAEVQEKKLQQELRLQEKEKMVKLLEDIANRNSDSYVEMLKLWEAVSVTMNHTDFFNKMLSANSYPKSQLYFRKYGEKYKNKMLTSAYGEIFLKGCRPERSFDVLRNEFHKDFTNDLWNYLWQIFKYANPEVAKESLKMINKLIEDLLEAKPWSKNDESDLIGFLRKTTKSIVDSGIPVDEVVLKKLNELK